ncbi:MAG TPA: preprotein translocase subunit SecG, partial [Oscillospiraceae bacterium]|nr:preprotein translocase subunit SecG [Oscillospiraceae bacterium]
MRTFLMVVQVIVCIVLIGSILFQSGKGDGLSGAISGGGAQLWAKQNRGFDALLSKITKIAAFLFIAIAVIM